MADPITLGTAFLIGSSAVAAGGRLIGGEMAAEGAEQAGAFKAQQLEQAATESRAASQRQMFEQQRKTRYALSTLRARSAMQGGATDTDVIKLGGDIAARGEYLALAELYQGENRARGLEDEATATVFNARSTARATRVKSYFDAGSSILKGIGVAMSPSPSGGGRLPDRRTVDNYAYG